MHSDDDIRRIAESFKLANNQIGIDDFDGYSPDEMNTMIYDPFSPKCPVQLNVVDEDALRQIPLYNIVHHLLEKVSTEKIKLESSGYLPIAMVEAIYALGYYKDDGIESGDFSIKDPGASKSIFMTQLLMHLMQAVKEDKGYLKITKKGTRLLDNPNALLKEIILTYGQDTDWSILDELGETKIGMVGWSFSLALLQKYGKEPVRPTEIAFRYFRAYPALLEVGLEIDDAYYMYVFRSFADFMHMLGLVRIEKNDMLDIPRIVQATPLLYKLISIGAPKHYQDSERN